MKYIDEYRDKNKVLRIAEEINRISKNNVSLMEVCGGHTMAIHKFGIPFLLPESIQLLSGPGCPVCVSSREYIDRAVAYSRLTDTIITTYGDLIRVPGSTTTLEKERAIGNDIRIVYSVLDAIKIAEENPDKRVVFLGIGFETTAPASAAGVLMAKQKKINNFFLYSSHKVMPPAMKALIDEGVRINGYIAPGHVSTITGTDMYFDISSNYKLGCVISGFEPLDLMQSIYLLVKQFENNSPKVEIQYKRAVKPEGNLIAKQMLNEVFTPRDDWWRGLGVLKDSGLGLSSSFADYNAEKQIAVDVEPTKEDKGCICGEILKGQKKPTDCKLFGKICDPSNPVGACMVSNEGSCAAYYRYNRNG